MGTLSLGIPYHTCNATKVARETTVFFFVFFFKACAGRFLCDDYKPNPDDDSNITRYKNEANEIKLKLQVIKDKISKHDDSLFSENTGKLKTGLSCHYSLSNDKRYYVNITSSIEKDVDRLIEVLDKAFAKYRGAYHTG